MVKPNIVVQMVLLALMITTTAAIIAVQFNIPHKPARETVTFDFNEGFPTFSIDTIRSFSFGFERAFSALLWLRFLQFTPPKSMGDNEVSWIYLDLNAISEIDPDFMPVFTHGALFLSVITEDKRGAELILKKGVERYPEFWKFRAYLAYHYHHELNKPELALEQYRAAAKLPGAPNLMGLLAATLLSKQHSNAVAIAMLLDLMNNTQNEEMRQKFAAKIKALQEEMND